MPSVASSASCTSTLPTQVPTVTISHPIIQASSSPISRAAPTATQLSSVPLSEAAPFSISTVISPSSPLSTSGPALSTPNPRSSFKSPARPESPHTPPGTPPPRSSASPACTTPPAHLCQHTPQCAQRQPKPPPPDKSSVLVHMGSMYHEHFMSHGVPARYGPHDDCMAVDYKNYGCGDCIWFKRWGELHGYPDLSPWKYVASGKYSDQEPKQLDN